MKQETPYDLEGFTRGLSDASRALREFAEGPGRRAGDDVATSFEKAGERIASALGRAADGGENAFRRLTKVALEELAKIALERLSAPRAPAPALQSMGAPVTVHFHMAAGGEAQGVARHQGQIAAAVARAVAYGRRNL